MVKRTSRPKYDFLWLIIVAVIMLIIIVPEARLGLGLLCGIGLVIFLVFFILKNVRTIRLFCSLVFRKAVFFDTNNRKTYVRTSPKQAWGLARSKNGYYMETHGLNKGHSRWERLRLRITRK